MRTRADMEYEIPINFGDIAGQFRPAAAAWGGDFLLLPCRSVGWDLATIGTPAAMRVFMTSPLPTQGDNNYYVRILTRASMYPQQPTAAVRGPTRNPPVSLQAATGQRIRWCGG